MTNTCIVSRKGDVVPVEGQRFLTKDDPSVPFNLAQNKLTILQFDIAQDKLSSL